MRLIGAQKMVLEALRDRQPVRESSLAERLRMSRSDLRDWLVSLAEPDLIAVDLEDGGDWAVTLTDAGLNEIDKFRV